ncbi:MAG: TorF family putative porin [Methylococcaceae bacterium]
MKKTNLSVAIALLATSPLTLADDETFYGWSQSASVALTSDYVWRGVSQTNNDPAIQGSFDLAHESGFYIGAWASNVEFADGGKTSLELDAYAGFSRETDFGGLLPTALTYDVGFLHYEFPATSDYNINEVYFGAAISPVDNLNFSTYYYLDIGVENKIGKGYVDISADYTLPDWAWGATLIAHAGQYDRTAGADDYWDWKLGIAKDIAGFNFEVAYLDTDGAGGVDGNLSDGRVVVTVSKSLGDDLSGEMLPDGFSSSASAALTTDYMWRGISQTNNDPAIQGSFDLAHESGAYIGVWGSNVEFLGGSSDTVSLELDAYAGFSRATDFGGLLPTAITYDIGFLHYEFPSSSSSNINEVYFGAAISPVENLNISTYYYLDAGIENTTANGYIDFSTDYTLPDWAWNTTILAHAGHYDRQDGADDYWDWKAGVAKDIGHFNFEVAYHDTDGAGIGGLSQGNVQDGRVVGTVSSSF